MSDFLEIKNLKAGVDSKVILHGVDLKIEKGQAHCLMGRNGSGKSTLVQTLMGNPMFEVYGGSAIFMGKDLLNLDVTSRAGLGIFLSFQYPSEVPGVKVYSFLRLIYNKSHKEKLSPKSFRDFLSEKMKMLNMPEEFSERFLNEGFSGGEKKRMEILQMLVLEPKIIILDEVDSGLDIDSLKLVSNAVNYLVKKNKSSVLLITHYSRILKYIKPDYVHVMFEGKIVKTGGEDVADHLEQYGYTESELKPETY